MPSTIGVAEAATRSLVTRTRPPRLYLDVRGIIVLGIVPAQRTGAATSRTLECARRRQRGRRRERVAAAHTDAPVLQLMSTLDVRRRACMSVVARSGAPA